MIPKVRRRDSLTPGFASVTFGGQALQDLIVAGGEQAVRLFVPREGQTALRTPTASSEAWMAQVLLMPKSVRPHVRPAKVYLEVPTAADVREVVASPEARIRWFSRDDVPDQRPGAVVLEAVGRAVMPFGRVYAWVAGESRLATSVRRRLVADCGVPKADISFAGYWRHGWSARG